MASRCNVCLGSGRLLQEELCPLCDGAAFFHDSDAPFFVFLLAGQSNMVGRGSGEELDQELLDFIDQRAEVYMAYDIEKSGREQGNTTSGGKFLPLTRKTQWSAGGQCFSHGPEWGIVQRLLQRGVVPRPPGHGRKPRIYFIKFAMGSSSLHVEWAPDGIYFPQLIAFTQAMLEGVAELERTRPRIDCCLWNQGNTDSDKAPWRAAYKENFVNFVSCVWTALEGSCPSPFPFVPLELHWRLSESKSNKRTWRQYDLMNEAFRVACQELGPAARVSTISQDMVQAIASHFLEDGHSGTVSLLLEGHHFADTFADMLNLAPCTESAPLNDV